MPVNNQYLGLTHFYMNTSEQQAFWTNATPQTNKINKGEHTIWMTILHKYMQRQHWLNID